MTEMLLLLLFTRRNNVLNVSFVLDGKLPENGSPIGVVVGVPVLVLVLVLVAVVAGVLIFLNRRGLYNMKLLLK